MAAAGHKQTRVDLGTNDSSELTCHMCHPGSTQYVTAELQCQAALGFD